MEPTKDQIVDLLDTWIRQRPGLDYANYGSLSGYRAELRDITTDLHDARELLRAVELSGVTAQELKEAFRAYSGRLQLKEDPKGWYLDYCAGQYWPTEYRKAAAAVLASALWDYYRPDYAGDDHAGDKLRAMFRRKFGRGLQSRWLN